MTAEEASKSIIAILNELDGNAIYWTMDLIKKEYCLRCGVKCPEKDCWCDFESDLE